jgi:hypothetical protein
MALPRIVTERFFLEALDLEIAKVRRLRHCVSVLGLSPDTLEPSKRAAVEALMRFATTVGRRIRATDIMLVRPPDGLFVMLVEADTTAWRGIVARLVGAGDDDQSHSEPRTPTWSAGGSCYPHSTSSSHDMLGEAAELVRMAHRDGGNRFYTPTVGTPPREHLARR